MGAADGGGDGSTDVAGVRRAGVRRRHAPYNDALALLLAAAAHAPTHTSTVAAAQSPSADLRPLSQRLRPSTPLRPALAAVPLVATVGSSRPLARFASSSRGAARGDGAKARGRGGLRTAWRSSRSPRFPARSHFSVSSTRLIGGSRTSRTYGSCPSPFVEAYARAVAVAPLARLLALARVRSRRAVAVPAAAAAAAAAALADDAYGDACDRSTSLCAARATSSRPSLIVSISSPPLTRAAALASLLSLTLSRTRGCGERGDGGGGGGVGD